MRSDSPFDESRTLPSHEGGSPSSPYTFPQGVLRGPRWRRRSKVGRARWIGRPNASLMYLRVRRYERSLSYLEELRSGCERKNSWEWRSESGKLSLLGCSTGWIVRVRDADAVQARLSEYVKAPGISRSRYFTMRSQGTRQRNSCKLARSTTIAVRIFATWHYL
jgi:hypothetical protein